MISPKLFEFACLVNPTRVEFELTERCNLACRFCYNSQAPVDSDNLFEIIDQLVLGDVPEIVLTGGEPVLHPRFMELTSYCAHKFNKVMLQTNGTLITDAVAKHLHENGVHEVNISIHGEKKCHDCLTQVDGSYASALQAISLLVNLPIRISSNFVVTKENIEELQANINTLYEHGVRHLTLTRFTPAGVGSANKDLVVSLEELVAAITIADDQVRRLDGLTVLLANAMPRCALPDTLKSYCGHCHFGASRFYIDINGNVLMCGMSRVKIGNILEESFYIMKQRSEDYKKHILGTDVPKVCQDCSDFKQCRGGCRAAALAYSSSLCGSDPYNKKIGK